jgi:hypothetical protein
MLQCRLHERRKGATLCIGRLAVRVSAVLSLFRYKREDGLSMDTL